MYERPISRAPDSWQTTLRRRNSEQGQRLGAFQRHPDPKKYEGYNYQSFYEPAASHAAVVVIDVLVPEARRLQETGKLGVFQPGRFEATIAPRADLDRQVVEKSSHRVRHEC